MKRIRDFATVLGDGIIDRDVALMGLKRMDVDALGLDELDRSMLRAIIEMYNGGPVGLETLAAALGEESVTLEDLCEPYRTSGPESAGGRCARGQRAAEFVLKKTLFESGVLLWENILEPMVCAVLQAQT